MLISVAIPCYCSTLTVPYVVDELRDTITSHSDCDYQIILVDDGSPDNTFDVIRKLCEDDPKIIGISLSRNFGQATAKMAAVPHIRGDVAIFMDDDGQHPADQLFKLIEKVEDGYDLVFAHFPQSKHSLFKRIASKMNSAILSFAGQKPTDIYISSYMAISSYCIRELIHYKSPFPAMGGYLMKITMKIANVDIEHKDRIHGKTGYSLRKMFSLWITSFTNFSIMPLRVASVIGIIASIVGIVIGMLIIIRKLINPQIAMGYTSIMGTLLFIGGLIMLMLGILGEYIGRTYMLLSNLPQYSVREYINNDCNENSSIFKN